MGGFQCYMRGRQEGTSGRGICCQAWWSESLLPGHIWWTEKTDPQQLSSDLHMCCVWHRVSEYTCTHSHKHAKCNFLMLKVHKLCQCLRASLAIVNSGDAWIGFQCQWCPVFPSWSEVPMTQADFELCKRGKEGSFLLQHHTTCETRHYQNNRGENKYGISYSIINATLKLQPVKSSETIPVQLDTKWNCWGLHGMVWLLTTPKCHMLKASPTLVRLWGDGGTFKVRVWTSSLGTCTQRGC